MRLPAVRVLPALLGFLLLALPACSTRVEDATPRDIDVTVLLPKYNEYLNRTPPRVNRLRVGGEETTLPVDLSGKEKTVRVSVPKSSKSVEVELSFWPKNYSNTFRSRTVELPANGALTVDLREQDPQRPDRYEAIYFPAPEGVVKAQMELAGVGKADTVIDLGSGDGRLVIAAVKDFGARKGVGIDIKQEMIDRSKENAKKAGVGDRCEFRLGDVEKVEDLASYSVVFLYLGESLSAKLQPALQKSLRPGTRVVSLTFPIGDWKPDEVKEINSINNSGDPHDYTLYLWRVK